MMMMLFINDEPVMGRSQGLYEILILQLEHTCTWTKTSLSLQAWGVWDLWSLQLFCSVQTHTLVALYTYQINTIQSRNLLFSPSFFKGTTMV